MEIKLFDLSNTPKKRGEVRPGTNKGMLIQNQLLRN